MAQDLDYLKYHLTDYCNAELEPAKHQRGFYICPFCRSGTGKNGTAGFSINPDMIHWKCFACDESGDLADLEAKRKNISLSEATKNLIDRYGSAPSAAMDFRSESSAPVPPPPAASQASAQDSDQPAVHSFAGKLAAWHTALKGSAGADYLRKRGITDESMERFNLGFSTDRHGQPCVVFPYNRQGTYYSTRAILDDIPKDMKHDKPRVDIAGQEPIFNEAALYGDKPCFVVESQLCALSIIQEGGSAVAIGGIGGVNKFRTLKDKPSAMLILSLDNDGPENDYRGPKAQAKLAEILQEKDIPYIEYNVAGDCNDPNELLQASPDALREGIKIAGELVSAMITEQANKERTEYEAQTTAASFSLFEDFLSKNGGRPPVPTGFNELDRVLNGGLTAGLYIMGAISSLGKTSWMLNIADNIAAAGRDVLYFSLEMSRNELMAKSISRFSFIEMAKVSGPEGDAFSTFEVLNSRGRRALSPSQSATLSKAFRSYKEGPGQHMWIFEGVGDFGVTEITQQVENHIKITGRLPVVFVDYLQILAPADPRSTDKQNTDKAVVELKRLAVKYDIPVFCISSLNRQNYSEPITMAAFKESGAIEYGSDVLIGIQLYGVGYQPGEKQNAHVARIREIIEKAEKDPQVDIEVKVLKNRNGGRGGSGRLLFDKKYNFFSEVPDGFTYSDTPTPFDEDKDDGWETVER